MQTHSFIVCHYIKCLPSSFRRNILSHINSSYLKRCEFNRATDPDCPIFRLKQIVSEAEEEFQDMAVRVRPEWNITPIFQVFLKWFMCHTRLHLLDNEFNLEVLFHVYKGRRPRYYYWLELRPGLVGREVLPQVQLPQAGQQTSCQQCGPRIQLQVTPFLTNAY